MARLTEEMVVARTKQSDIGQVTKLNCWGSELSDVRLLRRMQNVEVLSLSVNKIRSLEDFQHCRNLVELFVRKNEIADLSQILYLQSLPRLKNLWLEENPCANEDDYRYTVLRALPGLKTLDKVAVQPEEVQDAMRRGRELLHPQDSTEYWEQPPPPDSRDCSPPPAPALAPAPAPYQRTERSPPRCIADAQSATFTRKPSRDYIIRNADDMPVGGGGQYYYDDGDVQYPRQSQVLPPSQPVYEEPPVEEEPPVILRQPHRMSNGGYHEAPMNQGDNSSSDGSGGIYRERSRPVSTVEDESRQTYDRNNRQTHERLSSVAQRLANDRLTCNANQRAPYPRRPITRSSNLLSAVLCLVKELDYPSLEVVEMAVKCRMDELED